MAWGTLGVPAQTVGWNTITPNTGTGWQDFVAASGAGAPLDASGNLGDRYLDTSANRWYLKRWVANREGAGDSILFPINLFPSVGDFDFSVMVRRDNLQEGTLRFASSDPTPNSAFSFSMAGGVTNHACGLWSSAQSLQYSDNGASTDMAWHTLQARRTGALIQCGVDGVWGAGISGTSGWSPSLTQTGTKCLFTPNTAALSIKACNLRLTGPGGSIIAPLNEGAGTTITNKAGANGTLTDGSPANFWYQAWVPLNLL